MLVIKKYRRFCAVYAHTKLKQNWSGSLRPLKGTQESHLVGVIFQRIFYSQKFKIVTNVKQSSLAFICDSQFDHNFLFRKFISQERLISILISIASVLSFALSQNLFKLNECLITVYKSLTVNIDSKYSNSKNLFYFL